MKAGKGRKRWWALFVILVASGILVNWDDHPVALELYLKRTCLAADAPLTVGDLVQAASGKSLSLDLNSVRLPYTAGRLALLTPETVREALRTRYADALIVVGQNVFVLPKELGESESAWFYEAILDYFSSTVSVSHGRIEVEFNGNLPWPNGPKENLIFDFTPTAVRQGVKLGPGTVTYRRPGQRAWEGGPFTVALHVFAPVAAPRVSLQAGEQFQEDALYARDTDLSQTMEEVLLWSRAAGPFTAGGLLEADQPIPLKKISRTLFVRAGDKVGITFTRKNITVGLRGRALGSGGLEDRVTVKPDGTERKFQARVTGEKEVLIELQ